MNGPIRPYPAQNAGAHSLICNQLETVMASHKLAFLLSSSENPTNSQVTGFTNCLCTQSSGLDYPRCGANLVSDSSKERCRSAFHGANKRSRATGADVPARSVEARGPESRHSAHLAASGFEVWGRGRYGQLQISNEMIKKSVTMCASWDVEPLATDRSYALSGVPGGCRRSSGSWSETGFEEVNQISNDKSACVNRFQELLNREQTGN
jgi:hypothetical protein